MSGHQKTILICDDSPMDRLLIRRLLESTGDWAIVDSGDGDDALAQIAGRNIDLVVTDLVMPNRNGLELVREIKQRWPRLPVVLVTGAGSEESAMQALCAGAASYSPKSRLANDLCRTVEFVLDIASHSHPDDSGQHTNQASLISGTTQVSGHVLNNDCRLIGAWIENLQVQMPDWSESDRLQIGMAVAEALTNAMHHGNLEVSSRLRDVDDNEYYQQIRQRREEHPYSSRKVHVTTVFGVDEIRIRIRDEGPGFDQTVVADPREPENVTRVSGRGLLLIRSFMDSVNHFGVGNEIEMIKKRTRS